MSASKIYYTKTDEAPALATYSLLPVLEKFAATIGVDVELVDISLAARILVNFREHLEDSQQVEDALGMLGDLTSDPATNIIKLPNISASIPQLRAAIKELQAKGFNLPEFPDEPETDEEKQIRERYGRVLGSAVNPVLREGNSDRRAPKAVKNYARKHPHRMGKWSMASRTHVAHMDRKGDFYSNEKSTVMDRDCSVKIELVDSDGNTTSLKPRLDLLKGEVIDGMFMSKKALCAFFEEHIEDAKETGMLWSLHVKATMMKVSHPIVFGHAVKVFYKDLFEKWGDLFDELGVNPNNGLGSVYDKIASLPASKRDEIQRDINGCYQHRPPIAMVNSDKGISNLHVPSDVIVDASMPAMIREGGKMWGPDGKLHDTKAVIPESTYATIYQEGINFCKTHGAFDPTTMGTVPNVGLMAQKAEEYGSHDKTFEIEADGVVRVVDDKGDLVMEHQVEKGDIWRMCQTKDEPIRDWVKLAVSRARLSGMPAVFWLDDERAHDAQLIKKVESYLQEHDTDGLTILIRTPERAMRYTLERLIRGQDTISVTGNVLRDYLTDLFPIMELGTSAKMLSIVPLMAGGGLFETGAGGSAPKHVQQFLEEGHLRWDSLGEFLAITVSFEHLSQSQKNDKAAVMADALDKAIEKLLDEGKSPLRKVGELDNRGSHFYLSLFWAEQLAAQDKDSDLKSKFAPVATQLRDNEEKILNEINAVQGNATDVGGYYYPDFDKAMAAMRPSETYNKILEQLD